MLGFTCPTSACVLSVPCPMLAPRKLPEDVFLFIGLSSDFMLWNQCRWARREQWWAFCDAKAVSRQSKSDNLKMSFLVWGGWICESPQTAVGLFYRHTLSKDNQHWLFISCLTLILDYIGYFQYDTDPTSRFLQHMIIKITAGLSDMFV